MRGKLWFRWYLWWFQRKKHPPRVQWLVRSTGIWVVLVVIWTMSFVISLLFTNHQSVTYIVSIIVFVLLTLKILNQAIFTESTWCVTAHLMYFRQLRDPRRLELGYRTAMISWGSPRDYWKEIQEAIEALSQQYSGTTLLVIRSWQWNRLERLRKMIEQDQVFKIHQKPLSRFLRGRLAAAYVVTRWRSTPQKDMKKIRDRAWKRFPSNLYSVTGTLSAWKQVMRIMTKPKPRHLDSPSSERPELKER